MKPTPNYLALMMSAAGLSLSLPAFGIARSDANDRTTFPLNFGVLARHEDGCQVPGPDALTICRFSESGRVVAAWGVASTAPSDEATKEPRLPNHVGWSHSVFEAYGASLGAPPSTPPLADRTALDVSAVLAANAHRMAAATTPDRRYDLPWAPEAAGAARETTTHGAGRDPESATVAAAPAAYPIRPEDQWDDSWAAPGERVNGSGQGVATEVQPSRELLVRRTRDETDAEAAAETRSKADSETWTSTETRTDLPSAGDSPYENATERRLDDVDPLDPSSIERVLNSLAEIAGSQAVAPAPASVAVEVQPATQHTRDLVANVPAMLPGVVADLAAPSAPQMVAVDTDARAIERLDAANNIVVATHSDRVLMSLAALLSDDAPVSGRHGARPEKTVVASHSEKVLETLALFQQSKTNKTVRSTKSTPAAALQCEAASPSTELDLLLPAFETAPVVAHKLAEAMKPVDAGHIPPGAQVAAPGQSKDGPTSNDVLAVQAPVRSSPIGAAMLALSTEKLDAVRGGFVTADGLKVSFGIERAVYLNGNLVTTTSLNVADLSKISGGQAHVTTAGTGSLALVQSGQGNTFLPGAISQTAAGIVIQNTLDNQKIQTVTRIDAVVNSSGIIRSMNLQSSMRSAVIDSLRR